MTELLDKLVALEKEISAAKGEFALFALFLREDAPDKWDLIASASWLENDRNAGLAHVADGLRARLTQAELVTISRIVILEKGNPILEGVTSNFGCRHAVNRLESCVFGGISIKFAYIITSQRSESQRVRKGKSSAQGRRK